MKDLIPVIRFEGFEGEWKKVKLGDIGSWSKGKLLSKDDISENGKYKCIHYGELFKLYNEIVYQVFSRTDLNNACLSQIGDILFPDSDVTPTGLARCSSIMAAGVILGGGILILRPLPQYYSPFISLSVNNEKRQIISRITGTSVRHINSTALSEIEITCSNDIAEQQSISNYFTKLDEELTLQTQKLSKLQQIKAASLQNMFPQEGQMLPKVRFAGFEGEWERVRLGEIAQFFKGKGYSKNDLTEKGSPIFLYGMMYTKYRFAVNEVDTYTDKDFSSLLSQGNEVIIPASGETAEDIACASAFLIKDVILGGDLNVICFDLSLYSTPFIALSISNGSSRKYLSKCAQGKSVVHLRNSDIKTVVLSLPSLPEQQAIANYFTKLDRKIELETQKLEKLKQIKSACLSKMFV